MKSVADSSLHLLTLVTILCVCSSILNRAMAFKLEQTDGSLQDKEFGLEDNMRDDNHNDFFSGVRIQAIKRGYLLNHIFPRYHNLRKPLTKRQRLCYWSPVTCY